MKRRASQWQARLGVDEVRQAQENFEMLFSTPGQPFAIGLQVEVRNGDLLLGSTPELAMTMSRTQSARAQEKHREKHPDPRIRYWVNDWQRIAAAVNLTAVRAPSIAAQSRLTYTGVTDAGRPRFKLQVDFAAKDPPAEDTDETESASEEQTTETDSDGSGGDEALDTPSQRTRSKTGAGASAASAPSTPGSKRSLPAAAAARRGLLQGSAKSPKKERSSSPSQGRAGNSNRNTGLPKNAKWARPNNKAAGVPSGQAAGAGQPGQPIELSADKQAALEYSMTKSEQWRQQCRDTMAQAVNAEAAAAAAAAAFAAAAGSNGVAVGAVGHGAAASSSGNSSQQTPASRSILGSPARGTAALLRALSVQDASNSSTVTGGSTTISSSSSTPVRHRGGPMSRFAPVGLAGVQAAAAAAGQQQQHQYPSVQGPQMEVPESAFAQVAKYGWLGPPRRLDTEPGKPGRPKMLVPGQRVTFRVSIRESLQDGTYEIAEASRQWQVEESIGDGGLSVVYRCVACEGDEDSFVSNVAGANSSASPLDLHQDPVVVIKMCKRFDDVATPEELLSGPDALTNYRRVWDDTCWLHTFAEEAVMDKCTRRNVLPVYAAGWVEVEGGEPRPALLMQLADGTLEDMVPPCGLPPQRACWLLRQLANGLHSAHIAGIIHRDLKSKNVLYHVNFPGGEQIVICDWGSALTPGGYSKGSTKVGTLGWAPEEQLALGGVGYFDLQPNVDAYPFGLLAAYVHIGKLPDAWGAELIGPHRQRELRRLLDPSLPADQDPLPPTHPLRKLDGDIRDLVWQCCAEGSERPTVSQLLAGHHYFQHTQIATSTSSTMQELERPNWLHHVQQLKAAAAAGPPGVQQL